jgi:hypothetical protein
MAPGEMNAETERSRTAATHSGLGKAPEKTLEDAFRNILVTHRTWICGLRSQGSTTYD